MKQLYISCIFTMALSAAPLSAAHAQGKSADSSGRGSGTSSAQIGSVPQVGVGSAVTGSVSASDSGAASVGPGNDAIGAYGQLGASHITPLGDSMFLQLDGGVDLDQQKNSDPASALNGRVGLGWKY